MKIINKSAGCRSFEKLQNCYKKVTKNRRFRIVQKPSISPVGGFGGCKKYASELQEKNTTKTPQIDVVKS